MAVKRKITFEGPACVFLTTTVRGFLPVFKNEYIANYMLDQFAETTEFYGISIISYALMPSHLHLIIHADDMKIVPKFMQGLKILSSKRLKEILPAKLRDKFIVNEGFRFWMPRYDDFQITSVRQFQIKMDYIHNNPVKAGLVAESTFYKFSSARDWIEGIGGPVPINKNYYFS